MKIVDKMKNLNITGAAEKLKTLAKPKKPQAQEESKDPTEPTEVEKAAEVTEAAEPTEAAEASEAAEAGEAEGAEATEAEAEEATQEQEAAEAAKKPRKLLRLREPKKAPSLDDLPSIDELSVELSREKFRRRYKKILRSTISTLIIVAAISVLVATLLLPILEIYGTSMNPNLHEGEIVVSIKSSKVKTGDIAAFYYNNRVLVKRIIGVPGDRIVIDEDGNVYVNNELLDEPYLTEKSAGNSDIEYPYTVPENSYFVLGDHRESSVDSRSTLVGCVEQDEIIGIIVFRVWPLKSFGGVD